ncbi:MAG: hypothetical protein HYW06_13390 [Gemmatimonadetes bacterium]|nr:hypothetical protein [Gemmatimonadota bacterium]MBI2401722.1 hypothetical protein [Gemmatimonadota bacterium]MBI2537925.1 hypothetical protein [Gemmatimonadota bacterium]MBI2615858.1 hypothetical protein [Gemmatimonadota bacterium]
MADPTTPLSEIAKGIPKSQAAVGAAAAISMLFLPDRLIPEQLSILRPASSIIVVLSVILAWVFQRWLSRRLGVVALVAVVMLVLLILGQVAFVVELSAVGDPPETHYYLVGTSLTDNGRAWAGQLGVASAPREVQVLRVGPDAIPGMYGASYFAVAAAYTLSTVTFLLASVLAIAAAQLKRRALAKPGGP